MNELLSRLFCPVLATGTCFAPEICEWGLAPGIKLLVSHQGSLPESLATYASYPFYTKHLSVSLPTFSSCLICL